VPISAIPNRLGLLLSGAIVAGTATGKATPARAPAATRETRATRMGAADVLPSEMLVPRNCTLTTYEKLAALPTFGLTDELIAYASPDSTFAVTKRLMHAARRSILIGI